MLRALVRRSVIVFSLRNRQKKAAAVSKFIGDHQVRTVILSGAGAGTDENGMIVERSIVQAANVLCAFDVKHRQATPFPFAIADGRTLPFRADAADLIVSNAVIEHVGDETDQLDFVSEHVRVGRSCIITTPNRWFPVESHTSAVFRHWSPAWRANRKEFTRLLSRREFRSLLPANAIVSGHLWSATFVAIVPSPHLVSGAAAGGINDGSGA